MAVAGAPINSVALALDGGWEAALCTEKIISSGIWLGKQGFDGMKGYRVECGYQRFNPLPENPCEKGLIIHEIFLLKEWAAYHEPCHYRIRCCPNIADTSQDVSQ
jgi:hypothetical protein